MRNQMMRVQRVGKTSLMKGQRILPMKYLIKGMMI